MPFVKRESPCVYSIIQTESKLQKFMFFVKIRELLLIAL